MKGNLLHKLGWDTILNTMLAVSGCMPELFSVQIERNGEQERTSAFSEEKLFTVCRDTDRLELDFIVNIHGSGTLQVAEQESSQVLWQGVVRESAVFTQSIGPLKKGRGYVVRFVAGTVNHATITAASRSELIRTAA